MGAGVFSPEAVLKATTFRGRKMKEAGAGGDWGMSAIVGMDKDSIEKAASEAGCYPTNFNCPGQVVISGKRESVDKAGQLLKEAGAKRVIPLMVSGPFHTPYMKSAGDALSDYIPTTNPGEMQIPVVFNCLGSARSNEDLTDLLVRQVQTGVRMRESIQYMIFRQAHRGERVSLILCIGGLRLHFSYALYFFLDIKTTHSTCLDFLDLMFCGEIL